MPDGVKVLMAIVYRKGLKRGWQQPGTVYSGSYGSSLMFNSASFALIDRRFCIRHCSDPWRQRPGEQWYEDGVDEEETVIPTSSPAVRS